VERFVVLAAVLVAAAGCGETSDPDPTPTPDALNAVGGAGQQAPAGTTLPVPYVVQLVGDDGQPVAGATIAWVVEAGGGSVSQASSLTDEDGRAATLHTLGAGEGEQAVLARVPGSSDNARFTTRALRAGGVSLVGQVPIAPDYGIHDTFVRDGLAFVFAWNSGVLIYDVGHGIRGGSPAQPALVSRITPPVGDVSGVRGFIHNGWWFHNPVSLERRYLFVGQEAPGIVGATSRGDISVIDVSDLTRPVAVAQFGLAGVGVHNFWVDEPAQVLYAAYYDGGVVALDISGTLSGDLSGRLLGRVEPGGDSDTFVWGVQVANGFLYASDMLSGFWQLSLADQGLGVRAGGHNVRERFSSDLWVRGNVAYTGTWGSSPRRDSLGNLNPGDVVKVWALASDGSPSLGSQITVSGAQTVSDVEVSQDGRILVATLERGGAPGFIVYGLSNPFAPSIVARELVDGGLHTGTLGVVGGRTYLFAAKNPEHPALMVFDLTALRD
jgi:hypothetical protein